MDVDARSLLGTRVILEAFVEPACAATQQPVEISPLLLLDDSLLLFTRVGDRGAAIDIGFGAWGAFRPARRITLARNGRLLACKSGRYAGGGRHDQQNAKKPHGYSPRRILAREFGALVLLSWARRARASRTRPSNVIRHF